MVDSEPIDAQPRRGLPDREEWRWPGLQDPETATDRVWTKVGPNASVNGVKGRKFRTPSGKKFDVDFCTVAHWDNNGQIIEENLFYDLITFMKQIGLG